MDRKALVVVGVLVAGYALLSHYSNSAPEAKGLAVALSVGPVVLIGLALLWRWGGAWSALAAALLSGALIYRYLPALEKNYEWLDLTQQCGVYALLAATFARSLLPGRTPLCTELAAKMHGALAPVEIRYTRRATIAWMLFYLALVAAIIVLFLEAPLRVWSFFVNFITFGLILAMGIGDYGLRRLVLPPRPTGGVLGILQRALLG